MFACLNFHFNYSWQDCGRRLAWWVAGAAFGVSAWAQNNTPRPLSTPSPIITEAPAGTLRAAPSALPSAASPVRAARFDTYRHHPENCEIKPDAPDRYTVVASDTLWGISTRYAPLAWCWPKLWGMNESEIKNPHRIYPGQVILLDRATGQLRFEGAAPPAVVAVAPTPPPPDPTAGLPTVKLSPHGRVTPLVAEKRAISAIPARSIEPFLTQPQVVASETMQDAPRIAAAPEERFYLGRTDRAYVLGGATQVGGEWHVLRPGKPLKEVESEKEIIIGYEAEFLGEAKVVRAPQPVSMLDKGEQRTDVNAQGPSTIEVVRSRKEMGIGDRLIPKPVLPEIQYVPRAPQRAVDGRVISIYEGVTQAGRHMIVTLNRGQQHGLEAGHVLSLHRFGQIVKDRTASEVEAKNLRLPDERIGHAYIFRVFDKIAYALVMAAELPVAVGDAAKNPE